jgi:plasmid stability protein
LCFGSTILCVRTTIKLSDDVFRAYKERAAARGTTFAEEVEEALRADLHHRETSEAEEPYRALVFDGDHAPALVDVEDHDALQALMDEEERAAGRS